MCLPASKKTAGERARTGWYLKKAQTTRILNMQSVFQSVREGGGVKDEIEQQNKKAIHADGHPVGSVGGGGRGICKM